MDEHGLLSGAEYVKLLVGLLSLADPIGNFPIIFALTEHHSRQEKARIVLSATLTFIVTLLLFAFLGTYILTVFGITVAALKVAGGILFLFYALEMLGVIQLPAASSPNGNDAAQPIGIVPIGIPILAGPGTITKVLIYADRHPGLIHKVTVTAAIVTVGVMLYFLLRTLLITGKGPDKTIMTIVVKVMGLILAGIAAEFILEGITDFLTG